MRNLRCLIGVRFLDVCLDYMFWLVTTVIRPHLLIHSRRYGTCSHTCFCCVIATLCCERIILLILLSKII